MFHGADVVATTRDRASRTASPTRRTTTESGATGRHGTTPRTPRRRASGAASTTTPRLGGARERVVHARVVERLQRLRLGAVAERLDAILNEAARDRADLPGLPRPAPPAGGRGQTAQARRDGHQDRPLPDGEDARGLRLQIPAVGRSAARPRARHRSLRRAGRERPALRRRRASAKRTSRSRSAAPPSRRAIGALHERHRAPGRAAKAETEGKLGRRCVLRQAQAPRHRRARLPAVRSAARTCSSSSSPVATSAAACSSRRTRPSPNGAPSSATKSSPRRSSTACSITVTP